MTKSPLGQALDYSQKLLSNMKTILENGSLEVDNNAAERAIKPFVIAGKIGYSLILEEVRTQVLLFIV